MLLSFWKASRPKDQFAKGICDKTLRVKTIEHVPWWATVPVDYAGCLSLLQKDILWMQIACPVMASPKQPGVVDGEAIAGDTATAISQSLSDPGAH